MRSRMFVAIVSAFALAMGAVYAAAAPAAPTEPTDPAGPEGEHGDFFSVLTEHPELILFAQAFLTADVQDRVSAESWTVFAPSDSTLMAENALESPDTLSHYIVEGAYTFAELWQLAEDHGNMASLTTLGGSQLSIQIFENTLHIGGVAQITEPDLEVANGYVHIIDAAIPMAETAGEAD